MIAVVGAGPAGLMAAEVLVSRGYRVEVFDAMPSAARKFLMAGKGGMNITHAEPFADFMSRYGSRKTQLEPMLRAFTPDHLRDWIHGLGIATFVGTSGRVFPTDMKAAPLLRAWLHRLRESGVNFHMRHRWVGWEDDGALRFEVPSGSVDRVLTRHIGQQPARPHEITRIKPSAVVLALGGGSWPQLGSDGNWVALLAQRGVDIAPLRPSNCGFDIAWSEHFRSRYAGEPLKSVAATAGAIRKQGECMVTANGIEGGLIYALSAPLREAIECSGSATLTLDLLPGRTAEWIHAEVHHPRGSRSLGSHLQSRLGLKGVKANLLREVLGADGYADPQRLAVAIKSLPLKLVAARPLSEAISSAGGVAFPALDDKLMLRRLPGVFCAGEMLDWEAPTGGYLLTACFASGRAAGAGAADWLESSG